MLSFKKSVLVTLSALLLGAVSMTSMAASHLKTHRVHRVHINSHSKFYSVKASQTFKTHKLSLNQTHKFHSHASTQKVVTSLNHNHTSKAEHKTPSHQLKVHNS